MEKVIVSGIFAIIAAVTAAVLPGQLEQMKPGLKEELRELTAEADDLQRNLSPLRQRISLIKELEALEDKKLEQQNRLDEVRQLRVELKRDNDVYARQHLRFPQQTLE